ncbi:hypothetical protein [Roseococcus pinisoli]|uniref:Uncharacterized protein n=1 Tax=Roseococcus pinisoli TaxID=2835040 RepID=A0ABS5QED8_9PROT|nr:hypothetical protein [Roseococcus pinisoli]MBS7811907.1 hypothetical protein [Roseococcus pinisoli]
MRRILIAAALGLGLMTAGAEAAPVIGAAPVVAGEGITTVQYHPHYRPHHHRPHYRPPPPRPHYGYRHPPPHWRHHRHPPRHYGYRPPPRHWR